MSRGLRFRGWLCVGAACLALPGCGLGEVVESQGVTVLIAEPASAGDDALLSGPLEVVGGCLGIRGVAVVFPHGTTVLDSEPLTIQLPGQLPVTLGGQTSVGGGVVFERGHGPDGDFEMAGVTVPASCVAEGLWGGAE